MEIDTGDTVLHRPTGDPKQLGIAIDVLCALAEYMLKTAEGGKRPEDD